MKAVVIFLRISLLFVSVAAWAANVADISSASLEALPKALTRIESRAQNAKPTAGDQIRLVIEPPSALSNAEPAMAEQLKSGPVEWGSGRILWWKPPGAEPGLKADVIVLGLTTYSPGNFEIPSIVFKKDGKPVFATEPKSVEFSSVGGDKSKDDIYEPVSVSFPRWVVVLLGVIALAAVLGAIYGFSIWYKKRKSRIEASAKAPRILTPPEEFEKVRSETEGHGFIAKAQYKPHYFALSEAAKRFLGKAYRFDAEECTARELVRELEGFGMDERLLSGWSAIFEEMDITKFTDQAPEKTVAASLAGRLSDLVRTTYKISPAGIEAARAAAQALAAKGGK